MAEQRGRRGRWWLGLLAVLFALLLAEVLLRLLGLPGDRTSFGFLGPELGMTEVFEDHPERFWRLRPDATRYRANRLGLRGPQVQQAKLPRDLRVACLGDSCTFGSVVRLEDTYGWRLQEWLQEALPKRRVQTILAALPGYSSYQSRVLFEQVVAPRRPDLTILYLGGYNDYVPAIGENDAQRGARRARERNSLWWGLRLVQLVSRASASGMSREQYMAAFKKGEAPDGRRVPLPAFRDNLRGLVRDARAAGSRVVIIDPPLPRSTIEAYPVARDYKAAVREVAKELKVALVDADTFFALQLPIGPRLPELPQPYRGFWPCFVDWVHPSVTGHEALASCISKLVEDRFLARWVSQPLAGPTSPPTARLVGAPRLTAAALSQLVLEVQDPAGLGDSRVMWGRWWIPHQDAAGHRLTAGNRLTLQLPRWLPPGDNTLRLVSPTGIARLPRVSIAPAALTVEASRNGNKLRLRFEVPGPAGWPVGVWASTALRPRPLATRFGAMHLAADPDGVPKGFLGPFMFLRLQLQQAAGTIADDGWWRLETEVDLGRLPQIPERIYLQGLLRRDAAHGVLTRMVELEVPPR